MEHSPKVKKLLVKLENNLFDIFYTEIIQYSKRQRNGDIPLDLEQKCVKIIRNFLNKAHIFFQGEHPKLKDVPNEAIFSLKVKINDIIENYNNPNRINVNNNNEPFTLQQVLKARKSNKTNKVNLRERKLQNELRKKEALKLEETRKRNKSIENKLNNYANDPILKGLTRKDNKLLSSRFHKMPPRPRTFTREKKPEETKPIAETKPVVTEQKKKMPPRPRSAKRKSQPVAFIKGPNVSLNN